MFQYFDWTWNWHTHLHPFEQVWETQLDIFDVTLSMSLVKSVEEQRILKNTLHEHNWTLVKRKSKGRKDKSKTIIDTSCREKKCTEQTRAAGTTIKKDLCIEHLGKTIHENKKSGTTEWRRSRNVITRLVDWRFERGTCLLASSVWNTETSGP